MQKICSMIFFLFSFVLWAQVQEDEVKEEPIEVILGIDKIVKIDFVPFAKLQIGNESVLNYVIIPQKQEITFKGIKPGASSVIVRNTLGDIKARYNVTVTGSNQSQVVKELKEFLGNVEGLEIGIKGESVYVGGYIVVPSDIGRVVVILEKYPDVLRLVELSPHTQRIIAQKMQQEIQAAGIRDATVRVVNGAFWLEGVVTSAGQKERAQEIAIAYIPDRIESLARRTDAVQVAPKQSILHNFITVNEKKEPAPIPKLIKITAQFVELTRDFNKIFGFKWVPFMSGDGGSIAFGKTSSGEVTSNSNGTLAGTISNLFPKLSSAKAAGYARVIQSGMVITKDKIAAKIQKSATKPFMIGTNDFAKGEKAESGFTLNVKPQILEQEKIDLNIGLSVKSMVGDPPETLNNSVTTNLVVKSKESAVVGGIVVSKTSTDFDRNPPFGSDSSDNGTPLFQFIRSKSYMTNKSQFVVFITPEIIDSASTGTEEVQKKFRQRGR